MNKKFKRTFIGFSVGIILLASSIVFSEPGSEKDPLVTLSYVEDKLENIKDYIDVKVKNISQSGSSSNELIVVNLKNDEKLLAKAGTELILRSGKSIAYGVERDRGISDVTKGVDIDNDKALLPLNHLLIVPRDDGRGAYAKTDSIFMVRGNYEIK